MRQPSSERTTQLLALVLAAAVLILGISYSSTAASGADAYGYVSQADMWLDGELTVDQTWIAPVQWPMARWTATPLGYRPSDLEAQAWHIVPMYSPGLPLLMAGAKALGGQELLFWIVPFSGALLVLATYGIGRRLASPGAGLTAAWLLATSPAVLFMLMAPMSDVPVAAAWALSFYFLLDRRRSRALASGAAAGLAILIRPNLVFVAAIFGIWYLARFFRPAGIGPGANTEPGPLSRREALLDGVAFSAGVVAAAVGIAALNWILNGSPFTSGYGSLAGAFTLDHVWPNATRYADWIISTQSPLILIGAAALLLPLRRLWPAAPDRLAVALMVPSVAAVFAFYLLYRVYEEWWFLRFVLTAWPFLMVGMGASAAWAARRSGRVGSILVIAGVVALGAWQVTVAADRFVFDLWKQERRYVTVGQAVRRLTDRQSVIFSMQHSGSLRYYGGRMTLRYDAFDGAWIDRAVTWLADRGVSAYILLDDWEVPDARERFSHLETGKRLLEQPIFQYEGTSQVFLWSLTEPRDPFVPKEIVRDDYANTRSVEPAHFEPPELMPVNGQP